MRGTASFFRTGALGRERGRGTAQEVTRSGIGVCFVIRWGGRLTNEGHAEEGESEGEEGDSSCVKK